MSEFTVIRAVSKTLEHLLRQHITLSTEPQLAGVQIDLRSPKEMREDNESLGISLWLYRVTRNGQVLNRPQERVSRNQLAGHPIPIDLYYLVTPIADNADTEQTLLGKVLQIFNDTPILRSGDFQESLEDSEHELRITLETLTLEELTRIWSALEEPYQLSVTYLVQFVSIDSDREPVEVHPVEVRESAYKQILDVS